MFDEFRSTPRHSPVASLPQVEGLSVELEALDRLLKGDVPQIVQSDVSSIDVHIVPGSTFCDDDLTVLDRELRTRLGSQIAIHTRLVDDLERTRGGKLRFVVSHLPREVQEGRLEPAERSRPG